MRRFLAVLAVACAGTALLPIHPAGAEDVSIRFTRDRDTVADVSVVRETPAGDIAWFWRNTVEPYVVEVFGRWDTDFAVAADYDGDGRTDVAVWRPGSPISTFFVKKSTGGFIVQQWGDEAKGDIPVVGDFDGDRRADFTVYRPGSPASRWYIHHSGGAPDRVALFGDDGRGDQPVAADYDGDGRANLAIRRPGANGTALWFIEPTIYGPPRLAHHVYQWGNIDDFAVPADYDGDGFIDPAIVREGPPTEPNQETMHWYAVHIRSGYPEFIDFGYWDTDFPVPAKYWRVGGRSADQPTVWYPDSPAALFVFEIGYTGYDAVEWGDGETDFPTMYLHYCLYNFEFCFPDADAEPIASASETAGGARGERN